MSDHDITDDALLDRYLGSGNLGSGDLAALDQLLERHRPLALNLARRFLSNQADAEDAVQTAYCHIVVIAGRQRPQVSFRAWMLAAVANSCRMQLREKYRRQARELVVAREPRITDEPDDELRQVVRQEVDQLPERIRMPLWLVFNDGLTSTEVAEVLAVPDRTVRRLVRQGIDRLRRALAGRGIGAAAIPALLALPGYEQAAEVAAASYIRNDGLGTAATSLTLAAVITVTMAVLLTLVIRSTWPTDNPAPRSALSPTPVAPPTTVEAMSGILDRRVSLRLVRHRVGEVLAELNHATGGSLPWACSHHVIDEPRHGISHDGTTMTVRAMLDQIAAATHAHWEATGDHIRLFRSGEDAATVIARAQHMDTDHLALDQLDSLDREGQAAPRPLVACAGTDHQAQASLRRLLELNDPPAAAIRLAGRWRAAWAVPLLAPFAARPPSHGLSTKREQDATAMFEGTLVTTQDIMPIGQASTDHATAPALAAIGTPPALEVLLGTYATAQNRSLRIALINALATTGDARAWDAIITCTHDTDALVAVQALTALSRFPYPVSERGEALRQQAVNIATAFHRGHRGWTGLMATHTLAQLGEPGIRRLIEFASADDDTNNQLVSAALWQIPDPRLALPVLSELWRDTVWALPIAVRGGQAGALGLALDHLRTSLSGGTIPSSALVYAVAATRHADATDLLLVGCNPTAPAAFRQVVAGYLATTRDPRADAMLIQLSDDADATIRAAAITNLPGDEHARVIDHLIQDSDVRVRRACVKVMLTTRTLEDIAAMTGALTDTDPQIRQIAARALRRIVAARANDTNYSSVQLAVSRALTNEPDPVIVDLLRQLERAVNQSSMSIPVH